LIGIGIGSGKPIYDSESFRMILLQLKGSKSGFRSELGVTGLLNLLEGGSVFDHFPMANEIIQNWLEAFLEAFPRGCEDLFPRCN
jgi:hypothetical protein